MEFENNSWNWDGRCFVPHLFGVIILTAAVVVLSTSCYGGNGIPHLPLLLLGFGTSKSRKNEKKHVRVFIDGCFDLMHYGHANALRQPKALGDELVVGVISDEAIAASKGPPVFSIEERLALVKGLKWVDEVIANIPYALDEQLMKTLLTEHKIDYIVHGDDPCILPDGTDAYALAKKADRYKQIKRTEGVSSTDIVGRILSAVKDTRESEGNSCPALQEDAVDVEHTKGIPAEVVHVSNFLPTSRRIVQFSNGKGPGPNARVVYIDGAFDLFHAGHVEILKIAQQLGDFLLVGIYTDLTVSEVRGAQYPLMNLHERTLSVLACRYVDEVIIGAPWEVTKDMITTFNISLVVHGTVSEPNPFSSGKTDPNAIPKSMGIFKMLDSPTDITTSSVARRIVENHDVYMKRNAKKVESEKKYYEGKIHVSGD
ncbi:Ethanolamine-phosphate cytidylyltransferase [Ancistrocladus abbreviatus]